MNVELISKEKLGEFNKLKREIDKRRGQICSLNKCITHHSERIIFATSPSMIGRESKLLQSRIDSKRTISQELTDLERQARRLR
jgi:hypothetical protein